MRSVKPRPILFSCARKTRFYHQHEAVSYLQERSESGRPYLCEHCFYWHVEER